MDRDGSAQPQRHAQQPPTGRSARRLRVPGGPRELTQEYGSHPVVADRWVPSAKRRSACGTVKAELGLKKRTYHCSSRGLVLDRDLNAAINLAGGPTRQSPPVRRRRQLRVEPTLGPSPARQVAGKQEPGSPPSPQARSVVLRPVTHLARFEDHCQRIAAAPATHPEGSSCQHVWKFLPGRRVSWSSGRALHGGWLTSLQTAVDKAFAG
ncbi:MAG: zinc ribbon domain-containing protein, partial [Candidatus Dormibacteria bacterium]